MKHFGEGPDTIDPLPRYGGTDGDVGGYGNVNVVRMTAVTSKGSG